MQWLRTGWKWIAAVMGWVALYILQLTFDTVARNTWLFPDQPKALVLQSLTLMAVIGAIGLVVFSFRAAPAAAKGG